MKIDSAAPRRSLPYVAVGGTVLFWGLSFVASKTILNSGVPPMTMVAIRFVCATVILNVFLRRFDPAARLRKKDIIPLAASGFCGVTLYFFFEARGIRLTTASNASLITAVIPVLTVLAEIVFFRARVSWHAIAGVVLSVIGVVFVVGRPALSGDASSLLGDLFMFGACICWVVYNFLSRDLHKRLSDIAITAYQSLFGTAFLIPLALLEMRQWVPITLAAGFSLVYLALFCSALSNFLYVYALSRLGPVTVTPSINLIPMVGVIGGVAILGEKVSWVQIVGGIVIIAGVLLVNRKPARSSKSGG